MPEDLETAIERVTDVYSDRIVRLLFTAILHGRVKLIPDPDGGPPRLDPATTTAFLYETPEIRRLLEECGGEIIAAAEEEDDSPSN